MDAGGCCASERIYMGTLEDDFPAAPEPRGEGLPPVVAYNHRLQGYKDWQTTFEVFDALWADGVEFKVRHTGPVAENTSLIAKRPYVEIRLAAKRADYLRNLAGCDLNVTNSFHETFCIAARRRMCVFGQPIVAPAGVTFPEITGRHENRYPYLFRLRTSKSKVQTKPKLTDPWEQRKCPESSPNSSGREFSPCVKGSAEKYVTLFDRVAGEASPRTEADSLIK